MGLTQKQLDEIFDFIKNSKFESMSHTDIDDNDYSVTATEIDGIKTLTFTSVKTLDQTIYDNTHGMWEKL
ncbi:hypothetical protein Q7S_14170 [Rahnella aquatilis HX2]|nr:hypothetical protein Q7S_14170 [Rahnella aquatilis HX2]